MSLFDKAKKALDRLETKAANKLFAGTDDGEQLAEEAEQHNRSEAKKRPDGET